MFDVPVEPEVNTGEPPVMTGEPPEGALYHRNVSAFMPSVREALPEPQKE